MLVLKFIFNKAILLHDYSILENIHCYIFLNFTVHPHSRTFRTNWCFPMDASASSPFLRERERSERIFQLLSPIHSRQKSRKKFNLFFFSWMKPYPGTMKQIYFQKKTLRYNCQTSQCTFYIPRIFFFCIFRLHSIIYLENRQIYFQKKKGAWWWIFGWDYFSQKRKALKKTVTKKPR